MASYNEPNEGRKPKRGPGRPKGSPNRDYDFVDAPPLDTRQPTACKKCGSTRRGEYSKDPVTLERHCPEGVRVTIWRRTQCQDCGKWRKDKFQEID